MKNLERGNIKSITRLFFSFIIFTTVSIVLFSCGKKNEMPSNTIFERLPSHLSGIEFNNELTFTKELNPYTYRNFFNGGGVAVGDINNDGLVDIYFSGNQVSNKLYLNKGNLQFEDITESAGVAAHDVWSTGVTMVDINGDSLLDIYVVKSGSPDGENRHNELFINNGDLTFTEMSEEYGLDITGLATDAMFFDYDRDGDLDMYLLNNSFEALEGINIKKGLREVYDEKGGDRLFRNELINKNQSKAGRKSTISGKPEKFVDVTKQAGIYSSKIGFGLDVAVSDINNDGWPDMYISNDFFERDYLYLNNRDGTFIELLPPLMPSISQSSMGADIADINHDGRPDIYVTDMLPESDERIKSKTVFDTWTEYLNKVKEGYHHQFVRNTLQLNNGPSQLTADISGIQDSLQLNTFSEISRLAGIEASDWSWTTLIADLDNDSYNDIFVTNGIVKDLTDLDYVNDRMNLERLRAVVEEGKPVSILFDEMPSTPLSNFAFSGNAGLNFVNKAKPWGLDEPGFSNGAAYADLNNDGKLDLIVNNANQEADIYRNRADSNKSEKNWLMVDLKGESPNTSAIGTSVRLWANGRLFYREQMPGRGFQSSVDHRIHFGLGENSTIDSLLVEWSDGSYSFQTDIQPNQILRIKQENSALSERNPRINNSQKKKPLFEEVTDHVSMDFTHRENDFNDFQRSKLLFHKRSAEGPPACVADINDDGLDDFYIGGAKGQSGAVFIQQSDRTFSKINEQLLQEDKESEDTACTWFDANGNGIPDLYVASGGSEFPASSTSLADRLYLNKGNDAWVKSEAALPMSKYEVTSVVKASDFNQDGHIDLFTGTRLKPFAYGLPVNGNLLVNDGNGNFKNITEETAPGLIETGLITDAEWFDYDDDGDMDLIIVGEWMPVRIFENDIAETGKASFSEVTSEKNLSLTEGLWQSIEISDLDEDGFKDIIIGNYGLNSRLKASENKRLKMWTNDYDKNGRVEQIITRSLQQDDYPLAQRDDLLDQIPSLQTQFPTYASYADKSIDRIFPNEVLESSVVKEIRMLESMILWNNGKGNFKQQKMDEYGQFSPVFGIHSINSDEENQYLLLAGNLFGVKPEIGRYDASFGTVYKIGNDKKMERLDLSHTGFELQGEVRGIYSLKTQTGTLYLVTRNNDTPLWFIKN
jgi:hypothetical protein